MPCWAAPRHAYYLPEFAYLRLPEASAAKPKSLTADVVFLNDLLGKGLLLPAQASVTHVASHLASQMKAHTVTLSSACRGMSPITLINLMDAIDPPLQ